MNDSSYSSRPASASSNSRVLRRRIVGIAIVAMVLFATAAAFAGIGSSEESSIIAAEDSVLQEPTATGLDVSDGYIADGAWISLEDDHLPAISRLDAQLLAAVRQAAADAAADGIEFRVTGGWRSPEYQQQLLDQAVRDYGSLEEALRLVSTPTGSSHVHGHAIDIGPTDADSWLSQHGADYGLCQVYQNEMWHFELLTEPGGVCPPMREDASS